MTIRVAQWATGAVGRAALRELIENPHFQLVGVLVYDPAKAGLDAGALCGLPPTTGVLATNNKEDILSAGADVLYAERFGVIEAAKEKGVPAFGSLTDQNSLAPDTVVTGPLWDMHPTVAYVLKQVKAGTYTAQDLKDFSMMGKGGASLAPYHGWEQRLPKEVIDLVNAKAEDIKSGKFRVDINEAAPAK